MRVEDATVALFAAIERASSAKKRNHGAAPPTRGAPLAIRGAVQGIRSASERARGVLGALLVAEEHLLGAFEGARGAVPRVIDAELSQLDATVVSCRFSDALRDANGRARGATMHRSGDESLVLGALEPLLDAIRAASCASEPQGSAARIGLLASLAISRSPCSSSTNRAPDARSSVASMAPTGLGSARSAF